MGKPKTEKLIRNLTLMQKIKQFIKGKDTHPIENRFECKLCGLRFSRSERCEHIHNIHYKYIKKKFYNYFVKVRGY
jgi:hypothetical protein